MGLGAKYIIWVQSRRADHNGSDSSHGSEVPKGWRLERNGVGVGHVKLPGEVEDPRERVLNVEFVRIAAPSAQQLDFVVTVPGGSCLGGGAAAEAVTCEFSWVDAGAARGSSDGDGDSPAEGVVLGAREGEVDVAAVVEIREEFDGVAAEEAGVGEAVCGVQGGMAFHDPGLELGKDCEEDGSCNGLYGLAFLLAMETFDPTYEPLDDGGFADGERQVRVNVHGAHGGEVALNGLGLHTAGEAGDSGHNGGLGGGEDGAVGIIEVVEADEVDKTSLAS
ncbi:hypothetical protein GGX14DRAFT_395686 [Mycena pura]|uniref:Uncharacterized protein n=1 Tax=Mycena pura TaxID=153505 RepID=A0AAD6VDY4_9AGAR|nr:hypothetical protein GGX14DRAFT_395686 [Mycena pura]